MTGPRAAGRPAEGRAEEGRIVGQESDAGFHEPILGGDRLPPEILEGLRAEARRLGIDPDAVVKR